MPLSAILCTCLAFLAPTAATPPPTVRLANFGVGDTLFIVVIALIVFGPKKLPEISRQVGKLLYEFRKASNDFKFQIEEELRASEQAERQKQLNDQAATPQPATPVTLAAGETVSAAPENEGVPAVESTSVPLQTAGATETTEPLTIQPPSTGLPVSSRSPYRGLSTENVEGATAVTAAGESLDEQQANAQAAIATAAAEQADEQGAGSGGVPSTSPVPTHHG